MSADSSPTLSAPTLNDENSSNMTAASVVDTYVTTTLMQAPFPPLDDVEGLQEHQKLSKETATMWRSTTRRSLYQSNEDVIAFNNEFSQFYDPLVTDAAKLDSYSGNNPTPSESEAARKNIAVGLSILEKKIESNQASCEASLQELQEFQVRLDTDYSNLDGDHKQVVAVYTGDQGRVQQMQDQIDADKKAMSTDMTIIASGATTDVVGGLMVAVGVLGEFESGGTSTALVVSGLAVIGGGSTAVGLAAKDYDEKSKDLARVTTELKKTNDEINALTHLLTDLSNLRDQAKAAVAATDAMAKSWSVLGAQFKTVIEAFETVDPMYGSIYTLALLANGKEDWDAVAKTALIIQASLVNLQVDTTDLSRGVPPSACGTPSVTQLAFVQQKVNASVRATGTITSSGDNAQKILDNMNELNSSFATLDDQTKFAVATVGSAPSDVTNSLEELEKTMVTVSSSMTALSKDFEQLGPLSLEVRQLTYGPVDIEKSRKVFAEVSEVLSGIASGSMKKTNDSLLQASSLTMAIDSGVASWRESLAREVQTDKAEIDQLQKDIKSLEKKKKDLKKDFWYCVLGAVACAAASTAYAVDISKDQDQIDRKNKELSKDNKEYQTAVSNQKLVDQLGVSADQTSAQSNAVLISTQALAAELNSISSSPDSLVESYVQAQAASLATSLAQLAGVSSPTPSLCFMAAPTGLVSLGSFASTAEPQEPLLLSFIGAYWQSMQLVNQAAGVVRAQPTISFNLPSSATLLQDQLLAVSHSQEWSFKTFYSCLQTLQNLVGTSNLMSTMLPNSLLGIKEKNSGMALVGLQVGLSQLQQQQANEANLLTSLKNGFGRDAANDATSFQAASMVMEQQFEGDKGELAQLRAQLDGLRATMEKNNEQIAKGASETVLKLVEVEAVAISLMFGLGAISIPAATGGELSVLVSNLAKASISAASDKAKGAATSTYTKTVTGGDPDFMENADKTIEEYGNTLESLVRTLADAGVVYTLVSNVSDVNDGVVSLQGYLDKIMKQLSQQSRQCSVLIAILENNPTDQEWEDAEEQVQKALDLWTKVGKVCSSFVAGLLGVN